ncbi:Enzymatic polyprotein [Folsomia candida]|uniref:Enzymatic polyprotein n=1 Tax=Folsomia candida TaxID=158441 RepID=A0A226D8S0_FOLCA|nr:Enzymatic polyprotein [Folsomia candida]
MEFGRLKFELNVLVSRDLPKGLFIVGNDVFSHFSPVKIDYDEKTVELRGSEKVDFSYSRNEVPEGGQTIRPRSADRSVDNRETRTANGTRRRREEGGSEGDCPLRALTYHQLERPDQPLDWSAGERGWTISTIPVGRGDHLRGRSSQRVRGSSPDLIEEKVSEKQTIANEGEERERGKQTIANEGERERKRSGVPSTSGYKERTRSIQKTSRASEKTQQRSRNCDTNTRHKPVKDRRSGAEGANNFLNTIRVDETEDVPEISTVKIKSTLCIEPNSCVVVPVNLGRKVQGDDIYFQPSLVTELKYGIKLHPGIIDKKHLFVSIWNLSPRILTLFRGTVLGLGRPCKEAIESKLMSIAGMGTSDGKIRKTKEPFDAKYFDINPDADPKDKEELIEILTEFWDVFAHDNTELGCTDLVTHSIDTGDHPPIRQRHFTIRTDSVSLTFLKDLKDPLKSRIARWGLKLSEFQCDIVHISGKNNKVADCLSRNPFEKLADTRGADRILANSTGR